MLVQLGCNLPILSYGCANPCCVYCLTKVLKLLHIPAKPPPPPLLASAAAYFGAFVAQPWQRSPHSVTGEVPFGKARGVFR